MFSDPKLRTARKTTISQLWGTARKDEVPELNAGSNTWDYAER